MAQFDYVSVETPDGVIDAWTSYTIESDLFTPADAWSLTIGVGAARSAQVKRNADWLKKVFAPGTEVKIYCGHGTVRALQMIGIVDSRDVRGDAQSGTTFSVQGRDKARYLVDNDMPLLVFDKNDTIQSIAEKAIREIGVNIEVRGDATKNRQIMAGGVSQKKVRALQSQAAAKGIPAALLSDKIAASIERGKISLDGLARAINTKSVNALELYQIKITEAKPKPSESIWDFLSRHVARNGGLLRMTCDGHLMIQGIDDEQDPAHAIQRLMRDNAGNNILSGGVRDDLAQAFSRVEVYGKSKKSAAERSAFKGVAEATGDGAKSFRLGVIRDNSIRTEADAKKRAEFELAKSRQGARVVEYTLRGHGNRASVYACDTVYNVVDEVAGIDGEYYVTSRTLQMSDGQGPTTMIRGVPKGSIVLMGE